MEKSEKERKQARLDVFANGGKMRDFYTENNGEKEIHRVSRETIVNYVENFVYRL